MNKMHSKISIIISYLIFSTIVFFCYSNISFSEDYTSASFIISDLVSTEGGGYSSSANYTLDSAMGQIVAGTSSAPGYTMSPDFLYYPFVTMPVISTTAGDSKVYLSWTLASAGLGWKASGYNLGASTVSGGPYSSSALSSTTLSFSSTGLINGTPYYFVVRVLDTFGNIIATSTQVSATPVSSYVPPSGGGGGGGGGSLPLVSTIIFSGKTYPGSTVTLLKDAQITSTAVAGSDGNFMITLTNLTAGSYNFSMYSVDKNGVRSATLTFPTNIAYAGVTNVSGILISPTVSLDKSEVKQGDNILIFGQSVPLSDILISISSNKEILVKTVSDINGMYLYNLNTASLEYGTYTVKTKASSTGQLVSNYSNTLNFIVGTKNVLTTPIKVCPAKGDLNGDCKVNLVDFSIASYWYKHTLSDAFKIVEIEKLNGDGRVNLVDFSIMAFYWTG